MTQGERDHIYRQGIMAGIDLCLSAVNEAKSLEEAKKTITDYADAVKIDGVERLKEELKIALSVYRKK